MATHEATIVRRIVFLEAAPIPPTALTRPDNDAQPSRPRLHYVYYLLALFDLVTVTLSLVLIFWITARFERSVSINGEWANRLSEISILSEQASQVVAPANNVFDPSRDADVEYQHFIAARQRFERLLGRIDLGSWLADFDSSRSGPVHVAASSMIEEAEHIFTDHRSGITRATGMRMATMDRAHYQFTSGLAQIASDVRRIQLDLLNEQQAATDSVRRFEFLIAGLIVCMVIAVTIYGHQLAGQMKRSAAELARYRGELEELVDERTLALEESHQRLRVSERLASIGTLAAGLGHDMNNVLFPIKCRLDALEQAGDVAAINDQVGPVRQSIGYLQSLSDGLRLLSLNPLDRTASAGPTTLSSWWPDVRALLASGLPKRATLKFDLPEELPALAIAPHSLTQAVFNLTTNAGEVIADGGIVRVSAVLDDAGSSVAVTVSDDGTGMSEEVRSQALDPFFTTKPRGLSTGLGMALVQGIARQAGGSVQIDSTPGEGTAVTLNIPVAPDAVRPAPHDSPMEAWVSIADARMASVIAALLDAAGMTVMQHTTPPPAGILVWVTDRTPEALIEVGRPHEDRAASRIIIYGEYEQDDHDSEWTKFVEPGQGLPELRSAISMMTTAQERRA